MSDSYKVPFFSTGAAHVENPEQERTSSREEGKNLNEAGGGLKEAKPLPLPLFQPCSNEKREFLQICNN